MHMPVICLHHLIIVAAVTVRSLDPLQVLGEYQKTFGESWRTTKDDATQPWQYLNDALAKYQV
jgi:hypothetical protein